MVDCGNWHSTAHKNESRVHQGLRLSGRQKNVLHYFLGDYLVKCYGKIQNEGAQKPDYTENISKWEKAEQAYAALRGGDKLYTYKLHCVQGTGKSSVQKATQS